MKTIIAATDFSASATNAVSYAAGMCMSLNAELLLLHVWKLPVSYDGMVSPVLADDLIEDAKMNMGSLEKSIQESHKNIKVHTKIMTGDFFSELEKICLKVEPYAVVMGSQGTTAAERMVFGGHTVYTSKHLNWPVINVPVGVSYTSVKRIGLACDLENVQQLIPVEDLVKLVEGFHAQLYILHIENDNTVSSVVSNAATVLEMLAALHPVYHVIAGDNIDDAIIDFTEKNQIDMLIMLPKRHSLFGRLLQKSHTGKLILHCHVPLMSMHNTPQ